MTGRKEYMTNEKRISEVGRIEEKRKIRSRWVKIGG